MRVEDDIGSSFPFATGKTEYLNHNSTATVRIPTHQIKRFAIQSKSQEADYN